VHEMHPKTKKIAGRAHEGRIFNRHGNHASPKQNRNLVGVDFVVFCFASVVGFHVQGMAQNEWDSFPCAEVSNAVSGKRALDGHNHIFAQRFDTFHESLRVHW
jgi:hypothetical protein